MKITLELQDGDTEYQMVDLATLIAEEWWGHKFEIELKFDDGSKFMRREMSVEEIQQLILPTYKGGKR